MDPAAGVYLPVPVLSLLQQRSLCRGHGPLEAGHREGTICPDEQGLLRSQLLCREQAHALTLTPYGPGSFLAPAALAEGSALWQAEG